MMKNELYAYTKTNEKNVWSMLIALSKTRSECFSLTRRVLVTVKDAPEVTDHRSCVGCVHAYNLDPLTKADPCLRCLSVDAVRTHWTAPESTPAPVPMTPEYAATMIGRTLDMEGSWSLTIRWVGTYGIRDRCGNERTYAEIAERGMWQDDGTPCAMPQRKDGEK